MVARELSNERIASDLGLGGASVKGRVKCILTRLSLQNRVQAALLPHRAGLVGPAVTALAGGQHHERHSRHAVPKLYTHTVDACLRRIRAKPNITHTAEPTRMAVALGL